MSLHKHCSSSLSLADLSVDIIDLIFSHLPDFETLRSAILISKQFSDVFNLHRKSIVRHVAQNIAGPPLDDLLTLVRFEKPGFIWHSGRIDIDDEDSLVDAFVNYHEQVPEWQNASDNGQDVKVYEIPEIYEYARKAKLLEEWFSFRHKAGQITKRSFLTPLESHKVLRALYRLMLFQKCFAYEEVLHSLYRSLPDLEDKPKALQRLFAARRDFLSRFPPEELHEIQIVAHFILDMLNKCEIFSGQFSFYSPSYVSFDLVFPVFSADLTEEGYILVDLQQFIDSVQEGYLSAFFCSPQELTSRYLTCPLEEALKEQESKLLDPSQDDFWIHLLESVEGQFDTCERCSAEKGCGLWNHTSPSFFPYYLTYSYTLACYLDWSAFFLHTQYDRPHLAIGQLAHHSSDRVGISRALIGPLPDVLLAEFHEVYSKNNDDWKREDWLCEACLIDLTKTAMPKWWINKKIEQGDPVPSENCSYGWNCQTMTHNSVHASRLNHFCKPMREDGV
ncbi:hypothetical protein DL96DRAFT_1713736 [Flagelloscypha sp. PMI_526]|nr:hypothetical protein DL96DRAFT_1713736 [Flagelloscypha sp. PMI_526]